MKFAPTVDQFYPLHTFTSCIPNIHFNSIFPCIPGLPCFCFLQVFNQNFIPVTLITWYKFCPLSLSWFCHSNNVTWKIRTMRLLTTLFRLFVSLPLSLIQIFSSALCEQTPLHLPKFVVELLTLLLYFREVPDSILGPGDRYAEWVFRDFPQSLQRIPG
jgi:hypothetical protein